MLHHFQLHSLLIFNQSRLWKLGVCLDKYLNWNTYCITWSWIATVLLLLVTLKKSQQPFVSFAFFWHNFYITSVQIQKIYCRWYEFRLTNNSILCAEKFKMFWCFAEVLNTKKTWIPSILIIFKIKNVQPFFNRRNICDWESSNS